MYFVLLALVGIHLWGNRQTKTLLLPSHFLCILDIILQIIVPILLVAKTQHLDTYPLALFIVTIGVGTFVISYRLSGRLPYNKTRLRFRLQRYLVQFDSFLQKGTLILFWSGIVLIFSVFALTNLIPALGNTELGDPRFFYNNPLYFNYYKYPYWIGISWVSAALLNCFMMLQNRKERLYPLLIPFFIGIITLILTRHRGPIFSVAIVMYVFYYQLHPQRLKLSYAFLHIIGAFFLAMAALFMREGTGNMFSWILTALEHGSSFVDFHEFVESIELFGDQSFLLGKTFLADLLGFIPQGILEFRDHYRWKEWTKILFDVPTTAGGYRLTLFGESYFNFGFIGVIIQGSLLGIGYRYLDSIILSLQEGFRNTKTFSASAYFLIFSTVNCIVSLLVSFYNILFIFAAIGGCLSIFLIGLFLRDLIGKKYTTYSPLSQDFNNRVP